MTDYFEILVDIVVNWVYKKKKFVWVEEVHIRIKHLCFSLSDILIVIKWIKPCTIISSEVVTQAEIGISENEIMDNDLIWALRTGYYKIISQKNGILISAQ